jgi:MFS family permease
MSQQRPHYRRNFLALAADWTCFTVALAFINYTTVIPSFVNRMTGFAPLVGLVTTINNGIWLLPQLLSAHYIASKERKKPFVIVAALVGRPMYLLVALALIVTGASYPWLIVGLFFLAETVFSATDGLGVVGWFDILSKAIPADRRGRLYSAAQISGGVLSVGAGLVVSQILGPRGPGFPYDYSVLFLLCVGFLFLSVGFFSRVKESAQEVQEERPPWRTYIPRLLGVLRENRQLRMIVIVRLLAGLGTLAIPFYVTYATDVLQLREANIGLFVSAQVLGSIVASLAMGYLNERIGSKTVTVLTVAFGLGTPLLALVFHYHTPSGAILPYAYALVFVLIGGAYSGYMQGFTNFLLDIAPPGERPAYVGLYNTLGGTLLIVPLFGGWLLQTTSYPVLFGAAAIGVAASLALCFRLVEPRTATMLAQSSEL